MQRLAVHEVAVVSSPSDTEPMVDMQAFRAAQLVLSSSAPAPVSLCAGDRTCTAQMTSVATSCMAQQVGTMHKSIWAHRQPYRNNKYLMP